MIQRNWKTSRTTKDKWEEGENKQGKNYCDVTKPIPWVKMSISRRIELCIASHIAISQYHAFNRAIMGWQKFSDGIYAILPVIMLRM